MMAGGLKGTNKFQLIIMTVFALAAVAGIAVLAISKKNEVKSALSPVSIWGVLDGTTFSEFVLELNNKNPDPSQRLVITYTEIEPQNFDDELLEAIADGSAPDLILIPHDSLISYLRRVFVIPYATYPERAFADSFVEGAEVFKFSGGLAAVPFAADPLLMYWNRDIFTDAGFTNPPATWEDFLVTAKALTKRNQNLDIIQSFVALGEYRNVNHAKDIVSVLGLQNGNPLTKLDTRDILSSTLADQAYGDAMSDALSFFTSFADPTSNLYSWNRALPSAKEYFLQGKLGVYFGYGSEARELRDKNPNLNFDVALLPQPRGISRRVTSARFYGLAVLRTSAEVESALKTSFALSDSSALQLWSQISGWPPVRRDLLANRPSDRFGAVLYDSALWAKAWLDPNPEATDGIFFNLIESITAGKQRIEEALGRADNEMTGVIGN